MSELNNPSPETQATSVEGEGKVDSSVGSPNPLSEFLEKLGEVSGGKYETPEQALEKVRNLNSFVGDQEIAKARKDADAWRKVAMHLTPEARQNGFDDPAQFVEYLIANQTNQVDPKEWAQQQKVSMEKSQEDERYTKLEAQINEANEKLAYRDFKEKFGEEAGQYYKGVKAWATAEGMKDVYEAYQKSPFKELVEADRTKKATSVVETNRNANSNINDYEKDLEQAQKSGNWSQFLDKHKGLGAK